MSHGGGGTLGLYSAKQCAVTNAGCAKDDVFSVRQIISEKHTVEILFVTFFDQFFSLFIIARPHFRLHFTAETFDAGGRENGLGRAADAHVEIDLTIRQRGSHRRSDVAIADHSQGGAAGPDLLYHLFVSRPVQHHHHYILIPFVDRARNNTERFRNWRVDV